MLPNLIIIGAKKCGTTSLHYYLGLHPEISMAWEKEVNFFHGGERWHRGVQWYKSRFRGKAKIYGEASPGYTYYPWVAGVPERMASVIPDAKLIYLVRDPIATITSHYVHRYASGKENRDFRTVLDTVEKNDYLDRCRYFFQLEQYLPFYPRERILVLQTEEFYEHRLPTMRAVFEFLGVDPNFTSPKFNRLLNEGRMKRRKTELGTRLSNMLLKRRLHSLPPRVQSRINELLFYPFTTPVSRPTMDEETRQRLIACLEEDIRQLREFTGKAFAGWSL